MENQTLGQRRVMAKFNPAEDSTVEIIKNKSAELIDLFEDMKPKGSFASLESGEKIRALSIAQKDVEAACMFAVKSNFIK